MDELRALEKSDLKGMGLSDAQIAGLGRALQIWPRLATMPKWLRACDPALQQVNQIDPC